MPLSLVAWIRADQGGLVVGGGIFRGRNYSRGAASSAAASGAASGGAASTASGGAASGGAASGASSGGRVTCGDFVSGRGLERAAPTWWQFQPQLQRVGQVAAQQREVAIFIHERQLVVHSDEPFGGLGDGLAAHRLDGGLGWLPIPLKAAGVALGQHDGHAGGHCNVAGQVLRWRLKNRSGRLVGQAVGWGRCTSQLPCACARPP